MRKSLAPSKKTLKIFLGLMVFALAFVLALPQFPVKFSWRNISVDKQFGGFQMSLPFVGDFPSKKTYFLGEDFSGMSIVILKPYSEADSESPIAFLGDDPEKTQQALSSRLKDLGYETAKVSFQEDTSQFEVRIATKALENNQVIQAMTQPAKIIFKQLKEDVSWDANNLQSYYFNSDVWEETDLKNTDILNIIARGEDIQLILSEEGQQKFKQVILKNVDRPLGIFLDDTPVPMALPVVTEEFANMEGAINPVIEGSMDEESAKLLALQINNGVLPVRLEISEESMRYNPVLTTGFLYKLLIYSALCLMGAFLILWIKFRSAVFLGKIYFIFFALTIGAVFRVMQIPLGIYTLDVAGSLLLFAFLRLILVFYQMKKNLQKGKPKNLAIFQAVFFRSNLINKILLIAEILAFIGFAFNILFSQAIWLLILIGVFLYLLTYRFFFYPLLRIVL